MNGCAATQAIRYSLVARQCCPTDLPGQAAGPGTRDEREQQRDGPEAAQDTHGGTMP